MDVIIKTEGLLYLYLISPLKTRRKTFDIISQLISQPAGEHSNNHSFISNVTKFHKTNFNNYHDNWWWLIEIEDTMPLHI